MKEYQNILMQCPLFRGIKVANMDQIIMNLGAECRYFEKGEYIYRTGESIHSLGIVLKGGIHIIKEDFWGNKNIIANIGRGEIFAEAYACLAMEESGVDVEVFEATEILFIDINRIIDRDSISNNSEYNNYQMQLVNNLLHVLACKNLFLTQKLGHMMQRSTREKLLSYLSEQSRQSHNHEFTIPFNRQQLADYLSVERSAMSHELGKLKKERIVDYHKNYFRLLANN